jgi:hypothetical protein
MVMSQRTTGKKTAIKRASDYEAIKPLNELCKAGKLFEVQTWIAAGKPVNPPAPTVKGRRCKAPLEIAIEHGFHSLIDVLLRAGAIQEPDGHNSPMNRALQMRRMDIVTLLVEHGFDPRTVDMRQVFESWDPNMMEYFIERGADVENRNSFAYAFCRRIRTSLRVFKKYRDLFPSIKEQANTALRYHCKEGNLKWVSLMLWAGADPYAPGPEDEDKDRASDYCGLSAIALAALHRHYDIFGIKQLRLNPKHPGVKSTIYFLADDEGFPILKRLLEAGMDPNDEESGRCSAIGSLLNSMDWTFAVSQWERPLDGEKIDTAKARQCMKAIHLLFRYGAKWNADEKDHINSARRALLKLKPDYAVEFVWLLSKYRACSRESAETLISTPSMKRHVSAHSERIRDFFISWDATISPVPANA